ncbi:MAG TPA: hypothetical protein VFK02_05760 [Kofleriaceae bacterium]|nr:hypothetical protein [Kofleriaceae bacterium]
MGALTWAEDALARAGSASDPEISAWAASTRVRYGVPRDGARWRLAPEDDAATVTSIRGILALINGNKLDAAATAARGAEERWPGLPGLLAMRCDLELRRHALAAARRLCARAIAQGHSSWALYLSGVLDLQSANPAGDAAGIAHLRQAIELDPELAQAWRTLAKALERTRAIAQLEQLRRDYQARFGSSL